MPITVNGVELTDAEVAQELAQYPEAEQDLQQAVLARILRRVLLDEAARQAIDVEDEEAAIGSLLTQYAASPTPDVETCRRFYDANPQRFQAGACVEAEHILFQVTPQVDLAGLRLQAEAVLAQALADPTQFATLARTYSNCPSAQVGGNLGQLRPGDTVPEFERVVLAMPANTVHPSLVQSRHGLHIVRVVRAVPGRLQPFEAVADDIAEVLLAMGRDTAWRQYVKVLMARADIQGIELPDDGNEDRLMGIEVRR